MTAPGPLIIDARHLLCPLPVIRLARAARGVPPGTTLTVLVTDPAARHDVPAWARLRGHDLLGIVQTPDEDTLAITVRTNG
jgi:tRNA 2-thiouridine synthesizing protein A